MKAGQQKESRVLFLKVLEIDERVVQAQYYAGLLALQLDDARDAALHLERAVQLGLRQGGVYYLLATAQTQWGDFEKAKENQILAIQADPRMATAYHDLGILYFRTQEYEKAIGAFKKALEIPPLSPKTFLMLGMTYVRLGKTENALEYVTLLRGANDELKATHLESIIRAVSEKMNVPPLPDENLVPQTSSAVQAPGGRASKPFSPPAKKASQSTSYT